MASTNPSTSNLTNFNYSQSMVPIFEGEAYEFWNIQMKTLFMSQDLWDLVDYGYDQHENVTTWEFWNENKKKQYNQNQMKDTKALLYIQQGVSKTIFPRIMAATTAKEAWGILAKAFKESDKASKELLLPEDKEWSFLLRFPVTSFSICLGLGSHAVMWKTLATSDSIRFLHVSLDVNLVLWCIFITLVAVVATIYALKMIFYFEAVRREYYHPIRVNFFFAPWITLMFIAIGVPPSVTKNLHEALWYVLMAPMFFLEIKIYGQWILGGQRSLSKVANPANHLSVVGNFVGASLGASMGLKEGPVFFFAVGLAHYIVIFVTLYQRLPTNEALPKELRPVFFLFVAVPSAATMAWANIQGSFDYGSRIVYFIALFLYFSLAARINFFCESRFSLAWWAYTFPTTGAAIATIMYSNEVTNTYTKCLAVTLSAVATLTVIALLITTIIHAVVLRDLFPNDIATAISETKWHKTNVKVVPDIQLLERIVW